MENFTVTIPQSVDNLMLPDPCLKLFYEDLEQRLIWLDTDVDEGCLDLIRYILQWNQADKGKTISERIPIKILFFSPGGDLDINNALIDTITLSTTPVYGINIGRCFSSAAYIFLSCHKRFCLPSAQFLLHQGSGTFSGTYQEILPQVMEYQEQIGKLADFVAKRTNYTEDEITANITSDWYIDVQEGLEKGIYTEELNNLNFSELE